MLNNEINSIVAENCEEYRPRCREIARGVGRMRNSCGNCVNFKREKCSKGLHDGIKELIRFN